VRVSENKTKRELTPEELERLKGESLPDREVMSLISPPTVAPEPPLPLAGFDHVPPAED
jgi:hypothetical protein